jgi:serine protease Do
MNSLRISITTFLLLLGCGNSANSQEKADTTGTGTEISATVVEANVAINQSRQTAITAAVARASPAVVSVNVIEVQRVQVRDPFSDLLSDPWFEQFFGRRRSREYERQLKGLGSGFVISADGYVVTNDHVAGRATKITVAFPSGETHDASIVGTDQPTDLTLLKIDAGKPLPFLEFSAEENPLVGEWAIALGNPFGLFEASDPTVTVGVVSAIDRDFSVQDGRVYRDMIQTDASINRGNSGGPLINAVGQVIGVNTAIYTPDGVGSIGLGFAVPAARALRIIEELKTTGSVDRSYYTGLYGVDVNQRIARALGLQAPTGVFVQDIDRDSPAERAGFQTYDVIVAIEGEVVSNRNDFVARLYDFRPGDTVRFDVVRTGEPQQLSMSLGRSHQ